MTVLRRVAGAIRWYLRALVGADAYEVYLARHARLHPGEPVLGEREFWRASQDRVSVTTRCC